MPKLELGQVHAVNYRHIISQLIRKPGAFEDYKYRDCLFPRVIFRKAYDAYKKTYPSRGHKLYFKILHLASLHGENVVAQILEKEFILNKCPSVEGITKQLTIPRKAWPEVRVNIIQLKVYDTLVQKFRSGVIS